MKLDDLSPDDLAKLNKILAYDLELYAFAKALFADRHGRADDGGFLRRSSSSSASEKPDAATTKSKQAKKKKKKKKKKSAG